MSLATSSRAQKNPLPIFTSLEKKVPSTHTYFPPSAARGRERRVQKHIKELLCTPDWNRTMTDQKKSIHEGGDTRDSSKRAGSSNLNALAGPLAEGGYGTAIDDKVSDGTPHISCREKHVEPVDEAKSIDETARPREQRLWNARSIRTRGG